MTTGRPNKSVTAWVLVVWPSREGTTAATVRCLDRVTANAQDHLDRAYDALLTAMETPEREAALKAAECMRVLTSRRARELGQAAAPEAE